MTRPPGWGAAASSGGSCHGPASSLASEGGSVGVAVSLSLSLSGGCAASRCSGTEAATCCRRSRETAFRRVSPCRSAGSENAFSATGDSEWVRRRRVVKRALRSSLKNDERREFAPLWDGRRSGRRDFFSPPSLFSLPPRRWLPG